MSGVVQFEEGSIRLDRHGRYWYGSQIVEHPRVERMLRIGLRRLREGVYGYQLGPREVVVEVEDAPFQVVSVHPHDDGLELSVSDETHELLRPETLVYEDDVPYCVLARGDRARFTPIAALGLAPFLDFEQEQVVLVLGDRRVVVSGARV